MLVLQRKKDESILINGNIEVAVVDITADRVKLSIRAPKDVPILRSELVEAATENQKAKDSISEESLAMLQQQFHI